MEGFAHAVPRWQVGMNPGNGGHPKIGRLSLFLFFIMPGWHSQVARLVTNRQVEGSNPSPGIFIFCVGGRTGKASGIQPGDVGSSPTPRTPSFFLSFYHSVSLRKPMNNLLKGRLRAGGVRVSETLVQPHPSSFSLGCGDGIRTPPPTQQTFRLLLCHRKMGKETKAHDQGNDAPCLPLVVFFYWGTSPAPCRPHQSQDSQPSVVRRAPSTEHRQWYESSGRTAPVRVWAAGIPTNRGGIK